MGEIALEAPRRAERGRLPGPVDQRLHQQLERRHRLRAAQAVRRAQAARAMSGGAIAGAAEPAVRRDPGGVHRDLPAAAGAGAGHHRRLQAADRGPRLARLRGARRRDEGVPGQGVPDAGAGGRVLELPGERAAALRRHRPHQGAPARRAGDRGVRHDADLPRQPVRERLQPVRAHLLGARAGRRAVPRARRGRRAAQGALEHGRDGAALGAAEREAQLRAPSARCATTASSPPTSTAAPRPATPRARRRTPSSASPRRRCPPGISFEWTELTYQEILAGNSAVWVFPLVDPARVPGAGRALREPGAAAVDHPDRADGAARGADRRVAHATATTTSSRRSASWCWWGCRRRTRS